MIELCFCIRRASNTEIKNFNYFILTILSTVNVEYGDFKKSFF